MAKVMKQNKWSNEKNFNCPNELFLSEFHCTYSILTFATSALCTHKTACHLTVASCDSDFSVFKQLLPASDTAYWHPRVPGDETYNISFFLHFDHRQPGVSMEAGQCQHPTCQTVVAGDL